MPFRDKFAAAFILPPLAMAAQAAPTTSGSTQPHNVILFVADGLRAASVDSDAAPAMAALRDAGVNFRNSHALYPSLTTVNAAALATGHYPGDTGDWANVFHVGFAVENAAGSPVPFIENDAVLGELDRHFGGDYLGHETLLAAARRAGYGTAAVGKLGPTLIQDHLAGDGQSTIVIDDATGRDGTDAGPRRGVPLPAAIKDALAAVGLPATPPEAAIPNQAQHRYFSAAFTKVVLPVLKARGRPFYAVYWSRDPDGTQHGATESKGFLAPGINGRIAAAAIADADHDLAVIREALKAEGLEGSTDIVVTADHGFSTIFKESQSSISDKMNYADTPQGHLPVGFLAGDLMRELDLALFDPDDSNNQIGDGLHTKRGNGLLGPDPQRPEVIVAANGGSDLLYLTGARPAETAPKVVEALLHQDYVSGIFVRDDLGTIPGSLPFSAIGLVGAARTPSPAIIVNFKSFATGCDHAESCAVEVADTTLEQGQGMHGSFSRADTHNFQAAIGPDFKTGFIDPAPSSNADIAVTIAHILGVTPRGPGALVGRVLSEAFPGGAVPAVKRETRSGPATPAGLRTVLEMQSVGETRYFDEAGFPGRTVGLGAAAK